MLSLHLVAVKLLLRGFPRDVSLKDSANPKTEVDR